MKMKKLFGCVWLLVLCCEIAGQSGRTFLDDFILPFRMTRLFTMQLTLQAKQQNNSPYRKNQFQLQIPESEPFPCDVHNTRSLSKPQSVHQLKPGDIDIVAALGDSLTAGVGATAIDVLELPLEERGKSFSIGGEKSWREYLTLPNILKVFNPSLVGYALKTSISIQIESQFNVGEPSAVSSDMPYMANELIKRMKSTKGINIDKDWKMITIFIGANDFCQACYLENLVVGLEQHRKDMIGVLRILRDNLPRTLINFILPPHLRILKELKAENPVCNLFRTFECPCLFGLPNRNKRQMMYKFMYEWLKIDMEVCKLDEFDRDDFTVVLQPFLLQYTFPTTSPGVIDLRYLSADCFHFSQKAHARVANNLWNNIMEPVGNKSLDGNSIFKEFNCPSEKHPYIFTKRNSY